MPEIGPALPPHLLAKRKRQREEADAAAKETGPPADAVRSVTPDGGEKKRRVIGPAMPPALLQEKPKTLLSPARKTAHGDSESSDDDFGPAIPTGDEEQPTSTFDRISTDVEDAENGAKHLKHDDWMMNPPEQDGLAARLDPSRRRPTKFGSGKASGHTDSSMWHETPEQKRKRLENEVLGIKEVSNPSEFASRVTNDNEDTQRKIDEYNKQSRGKSLYEMHDGKRKQEGKTDEDDPSKRAFDREKDVGGGTLNFTQRKEMLGRASNFGSRFSGGGYL